MAERLFERLLGISTIAKNFDLSAEDDRKRIEALDSVTIDKDYLNSLISQPGKLYQHAADIIMGDYKSNPILRNKLDNSVSIASQLATFSNQRFMKSDDIRAPVDYDERVGYFSELTFVPHLEMGTYETRASRARHAGFVAMAIPLPVIAASTYAWSQFNGQIPQLLVNIAFTSGLILAPVVGVATSRHFNQTYSQQYLLRASFADNVAKNLDYLIDKATEVKIAEVKEV